MGRAQMRAAVASAHARRGRQHVASRQQCSACASCCTPHGLPSQAHGGGSSQARNRMSKLKTHCCGSGVARTASGITGCPTVAHAARLRELRRNCDAAGEASAQASHDMGMTRAPPAGAGQPAARRRRITAPPAAHAGACAHASWSGRRRCRRCRRRPATPTPPRRPPATARRPASGSAGAAARP